MEKMRKDFVQEFDFVFELGCILHVINLICKAVFKGDIMKPIMENWDWHAKDNAARFRRKV